MKAAVYHGNHILTVEEVPDKHVGDEEVKVGVRYCGICGTDIHIYNGDGGSTDVTPPLIPGHELSGVVVEIGSKVKRIQIGDRVSVDPNDMCESCYYCRSGKKHFCENMQATGVTYDGGFAEYVTAREKQVYVCPDNISDMEAAMAEPLSCCIHGIDLCHIKSGDNVLIIGGGPIGLLMLQLAGNEGASSLILSEPVKEKRELAQSLGADLVIDPLHEDIGRILSENYKNIDVVIECTGIPSLQSTAIKLAGRGATVMLFGLAAPDASFNLFSDDVFKKELTITSSYINPYTYERALKVLASKSLEIERLITSVIPLDDIEKAFTDPAYRRGGKVMVRINQLEE